MTWPCQQPSPHDSGRALIPKRAERPELMKTARHRGTKCLGFKRPGRSRPAASVIPVPKSPAAPDNKGVTSRTPYCTLANSLSELPALACAIFTDQRKRACAECPTER